jgi:uncharacterized protein
MSKQKPSKGTEEEGHCSLVSNTLAHASDKAVTWASAHMRDSQAHTLIAVKEYHRYASQYSKQSDLKNATCLTTHLEGKNQLTFLLVSTAAAYRFFSRAMRAAVASACSLFCFSMRSLMSASDLSWAAVACALYSVCRVYM